MITTAVTALADLARLSRQAGAVHLAEEAESLAERVREGRFYVVCVGQFKRGKSALINALVGRAVLPTGVVPVTSVVTIVRDGPALAARVRLVNGEWEESDPGALIHWVSEEHNPGNEKGVAGVEVFVPSPLLATGLCLVDTPGVGSTSAANSAATREFLPRVDAALVVIGADPPISGEELAVVQQLAESTSEILVVLNKADQLPDAPRAEVRRFTDRVLAERSGRRLDPVLEVSALERLVGAGPTRDWPRLLARLETLSARSGSDLVEAAGRRGFAALRRRLLHDLDEQHAALLRPIEETRSRVALVKQAARGAEDALAELGHRLDAVQERLVHAFTESRDRFFGQAMVDARDQLSAAIRATSAGPAFRDRALEMAVDVSRRAIDRWRHEQEPVAEALFREGFGRFVELADQFRAGVAATPGLAHLGDKPVEAAFAAKSRFHYTEMLTIAPASLWARALDMIRPRRSRARAVERDARAYLTRLLEVNGSRLKNDFVERLRDSRHRLEQGIRARLQALSTDATRLLDQTTATQTAGTAAVRSRIEAIARLRSALERLALPPLAPAADTSEG